MLGEEVGEQARCAACFRAGDKAKMAKPASTAAGSQYWFCDATCYGAWFSSPSRLLSRVDSLVPLELSVAQDKDARTAAVENRLRSHIGEAFDAARKAKGLSIRALAKEMGTSISQVQRMLHEDIGGGLTLRTLVRGADVLGLSVSFHLEPQEQAYARDALESLKRWEGKLLSSMMLPHELLEEKPHGER